MGINHIHLSEELIAALYPESIIVQNDPDQEINHFKSGLTRNEYESGYPFLGSNDLSICFLVNYPGVEFIPEDQLVFLQKILSACKINLNDIALINTNLSPVDMQVLKKQLQPRIIFLWGTIPALTGMARDFPDMTVSFWENIQILPVKQVELMIVDNPEGIELKRKLWISLKKIFNL